jgi:hypothetical protein
MSAYKEYFTQQWILKQVDETYLQKQVNKGRITLLELEEITRIEA